MTRGVVVTGSVVAGCILDVIADQELNNAPAVLRSCYSSLFGFGKYCFLNRLLFVSRGKFQHRYLNILLKLYFTKSRFFELNLICIFVLKLYTKNSGLLPQKLTHCA